MLHYEIVRTTPRLRCVIERVIRRNATKVLLVRCHNEICIRSNVEEWVYVTDLSLVTQLSGAYNETSCSKQACVTDLGVMLDDLIRGVRTTSTHLNTDCSDCKRSAVAQAVCPNIDSSLQHIFLRRGVKQIFVHDLLATKEGSKTQTKTNKGRWKQDGKEVSIATTTKAGTHIKPFSYQCKRRSLWGVQRTCRSVLTQWLEQLVEQEVAYNPRQSTPTGRASRLARNKRAKLDRLLVAAKNAYKNWILLKEPDDTQKRCIPMMTLVNACHIMFQLI